MKYRVQLDIQSIEDAGSWQKAQIQAARQLIEQVRNCSDRNPVRALLDLGFSIGVRQQ